MNVQRVTDSTGSHIEPPLDESWSDLVKLQWWADVMRMDVGIALTVESGGLKMYGSEVPGYFTLRVAGGRYWGPLRFEDAWDFINGMVFGVEAYVAQLVKRG